MLKFWEMSISHFRLPELLVQHAFGRILVKMLSNKSTSYKRIWYTLYNYFYLENLWFILCDIYAQIIKTSNEEIPSLKSKLDNSSKTEEFDLETLS